MRGLSTLCLALCLITGGLLSMAQGQESYPVLLKELSSREYSLHSGGYSLPEYKEVHSREASLFVENGPAEPHRQVISREATLVVASMAAPPPIDNLSVKLSPTGETATLDWSGYNPWAVGDVKHFDIYYSDQGPITDLSASDVELRKTVGGETLTAVIDELAPGIDHYFVVVPVDALDHFDPNLAYGAGYLYSPEVVSREVSLFIGGDTDPPVKALESREISLVVASTALPPPVADLKVTLSPIGETATLDWSGYNPWVVGDVKHFDIYYSDQGPITDLSASDVELRKTIGGETLTAVIDELAPGIDHYFVVVPVDALDHFDPNFAYGAGYLYSPEVVSREVSLFVGGDGPTKPRELISREVSLLTPGSQVPAPVTGLDSGFFVETSRQAFAAVDMDWRSYNELAQQDVVRYRIYYSSTGFFDDVSGLTPFKYVPAGTQQYTLTGLPASAILHFAVVAEDALGNFDPQVRSFSALTSIAGVGEVAGLSAVSAFDRLTFNWIPPASEATLFLSHYHLYFAGSNEPVVLPADALSWEKQELTPATGYTLRIATVDVFGNESDGVSIDAATLLPNPTNLHLRGVASSTILSWRAAEPTALVQHYAIYRSTSPITDITGLPPFATRTGLTLTLGPFDEIRDLHFAVTTVNISDGTDPLVTSVPAADFEDLSPPLITDIRFSDQLLSDGFTATRPGELSLTATDPSAVGRVEFALDGAAPFATVVSPTDQYKTGWNIAAFSDGAHSLRITAYDTYGNVAVVEHDINIALAPPPAPDISHPPTGYSTNNTTVVISGSATADSESVQLFLNGAPFGAPVAVNAGAFTASVVLPAGDNSIQAAATNRGGPGPLSAAIAILVDQSIPDPPIGLYAKAREAGQIRLTWNASRDAAVTGYEVYRSNQPFDGIAAALRVNSGQLTVSTFDDLPPADGSWYYRVASVNGVGTRSALSNQVSAVADSLPPVAASIDYQTQGPYDSASGRIGVGRVDVTLTLNEPVQTTPFLSIAPEAGVPRSIALTWSGELSYVGSFDVTSTTPSGTAYAVFSARDKAGNRGSEILSGATIELDTDGPGAIGFSVSPASPIRNDTNDPVSVQVEFGLTEALAEGDQPVLEFLLSAAGREPQSIDLTSVTDNLWQGLFTLPADAGEAAPESLTFRFEALDDLGNLGTQIEGPHSVQVYQGDLPPPDTPTGLTAVALPDGEVRLNWDSVAEAADYQLYRASAGEDTLAPLVRTAGALEWREKPGADGLYRYAVASVRSANGQEGLSAPGEPVEVKADATPPLAPTGLALSVLPTGVQASWEAPADDDTLSYAVYRFPGTGIGSLEGATPVTENLLATSALDPSPPQPEEGHISYVVVAVDPAGNLSDSSSWAFVNVDLLPVATFEVTQSDNDFPLLGWTHVNAVAGFDLYLGAGSSRLKLTPTPLTATSYQDIGWSGGERLYSLTAVDGTGSESLSRSLRLPALSAARIGSDSIKRGIMNELTYELTNSGAEVALAVVLELDIAGKVHRSAPVDVPPGGSNIASVIVGGYADLADLTELTVALEQRPNPGERVRIVRSESVVVTDGVLVLDLLTRNMTRGGEGQVRFALENITDVALQIVTATANGSAPSDDIRFSLLDRDGNYFGGIDLRQALGASLTTLPDGRLLAEIPPAGRFESDWLSLPIPSAAPNSVQLVLEIDRLHYHLGQQDAVSIAGRGTQRETALIDTSYTGELLSIQPEHSFGDQPITLTGRALHRASGQPLGRVPLHLVIGSSGFERLFEMFTDNDGSFTYDYLPLAAESGAYRVSVVHPDLLERPEQGGFSIGRVFVDPARRALSFPREVETPLLFGVTAGRGFPVTNLGFRYLAEDQVFGSFETGITVDTGPAINLTAGATGQLELKLNADQTARYSGPLILRLVADESGDLPLALVRIDYTLSEAEPALFHQPSHLELGAAPGGRVSGRVTLSNQGLAAMEGVRADLILTATGEKPAWGFLTTPAAIGNLAIGAERTLDLLLAPTDSVPEGIHELAIRVRADNHASRDIPVYAYITRSGIGSVLFHVSDIYTATLDGAGNPIPGLQNAVVRIQNEKVPTIEQTANTDDNGELLFENLAAGSYLFRVSAPDHEAVFGRFTIQPGVTLAREVFLDYDLITIEWEVVEIPLEDRYEIILTAIYETDVPAPVVLIEPPGITLPTMAPGEIYQGELTITNYGLIRADDLVFTPAPDDEYFDYEFMAEIPESLGAKERVTVPYRIVALRSLTGSGAQEDTGGGDCGYGSNAHLTYRYICANGTRSGGGSGFGISANVSSSCGGPGGGVGPPPGGGSGSGGGGGYGGGSPTSVIPCPPDCEGECCSSYGGGPGAGGASPSPPTGGSY